MLGCWASKKKQLIYNNKYIITYPAIRSVFLARFVFPQILAGIIFLCFVFPPEEPENYFSVFCARVKRADLGQNFKK